MFKELKTINMSKITAGLSDDGEARRRVKRWKETDGESSCGEKSSVNHQSVKLEMHIIIDFKHGPQEVLIEVIRGVK